MRKRGHVIPLRLTDQELAHLNRCAAASGLPREEYLRSLIMGKTITPRPCTHHADLLRKVAGLCNNANQLARRANSTGMAGPESVEEMARIARVVWEEVREIGKHEGACCKIRPRVRRVIEKFTTLRYNANTIEGGG